MQARELIVVSPIRSQFKIREGIFRIREKIVVSPKRIRGIAQKISFAIIEDLFRDSRFANSVKDCLLYRDMISSQLLPKLTDFPIAKDPPWNWEG